MRGIAVHRWACVLLAGLLVGVGGCGGARPTRAPKVELVEADARATIRARRPAAGGYVLSTGDLFKVSFLFEPELSSEVRVRPDGAVALPILGDVRVAGTTPSALDSLLTDAYSAYFRDPEITINVIQFSPPTVYLLGEVQNPKSIPLAPGMSVLQALAMAGGPTPGASLGSVILFRRTGKEQAIAQRIDLSDFLGGKQSSWDLLLAPYDIIYVPTNFITKVDRFVDRFFAKLTPVPTLYLRGWEAFNTDEVYDTFFNNTSSTERTSP